MRNKTLQPNEKFDSMRGTNRYIHEEPQFESYPSLEEYRKSHAGSRFVLAKIGIYYRTEDKPRMEIWEDLPLDHDHMFQSVRLILKCMNEWCGIGKIRVDFAGDIINPFVINVAYVSFPDSSKK